MSQDVVWAKLARAMRVYVAERMTTVLHCKSGKRVRRAKGGLPKLLPG